MSRQQTNVLPKESPQTQSKNHVRTGTKKHIHWHWLLQHPVEFSKNKHTPDPPPRRGSRTGATSRIYSVSIGLVKSFGATCTSLTVPPVLKIGRASCRERV